MGDHGITVHRWPQCGTRPEPDQDLLVVAVDTPPTAIRDTARHLVRTALREILAALLHGPVTLLSSPGQAPRVAGHSAIHLSVSHEPGLSLLAIHRSGPLGIDLLRLPESPPWQTEITGLAADYLGPAVAARLAGLPAAEQAVGFAEAWTHYEARLKCLGIGLTEWHPAIGEQRAVCQSFILKLPAGFVGALATLPAKR